MDIGGKFGLLKKKNQTVVYQLQTHESPQAVQRQTRVTWKTQKNPRVAKVQTLEGPNKRIPREEEAVNQSPDSTQPR